MSLSIPQRIPPRTNIEPWLTRIQARDTGAIEIKPEHIEMHTLDDTGLPYPKLTEPILEKAFDNFRDIYFFWFPKVASVLKDLTSSTHVTMASRALQYRTTIEIEQRARKELPEFELVGNTRSIPVALATTKTNDLPPHVDVFEMPDSVLSFGYASPNDWVHPGVLNLHNLRDTMFYRHTDAIKRDTISPYLTDAAREVAIKFTPPDQNPWDNYFLVAHDGALAHSTSGIMIRDVGRAYRPVSNVWFRYYVQGEDYPFKFPYERDAVEAGARKNLKTFIEGE